MYARRERGWALAGPGIPERTLLRDGSACLGDDRVSDMTAVRRWSSCFDRDELRGWSFFRQDSLPAAGSRTQGRHSDWRCPRRWEICAPGWRRLPLERQDISPKGACTRAGLCYSRPDIDRWCHERATLPFRSLSTPALDLLSEWEITGTAGIEVRRSNERHTWKCTRRETLDRIDSPLSFRTFPDSPEFSLFLSRALAFAPTLSRLFSLDSSSSIKNSSSTVSLHDARSYPPSWTFLPPVPRWLPLVILSSRKRFSMWTQSQSQTTHFFLRVLSSSDIPGLPLLSRSFFFLFFFSLCAPELFLVFLYPKLQHWTRPHRRDKIM